MLESTKKVFEYAKNITREKDNLPPFPFACWSSPKQEEPDIAAFYIPVAAIPGALKSFLPQVRAACVCVFLIVEVAPKGSVQGEPTLEKLLALPELQKKAMIYVEDSVSSEIWVAPVSPTKEWWKLSGEFELGAEDGHTMFGRLLPKEAVN